MKALILAFAIALCFVSLPLTSAETLHEPSESPFVRIDALPRWLVERVKASKYLNVNNLTFISLLQANWVLRVHTNENLTKQDQEFMLSHDHTWEQKYHKLDQILEDDPGLYQPKYVMMSSLNLSYARNISEAISPIMKLYAGHPTITWPMNKALTQKSIEEKNIPYALLLHDSLRYRMIPFNNATIYRGMLCNPQKINETLGQVIQADQFFSFSKNADWADFFMWYHKPEGDLQPCYMTLPLTSDNICGSDIEDMSLQKEEYEVLINYGTRIRMSNLTEAFSTKKNKTFYKVNWECLDKTKDLNANAINEPKLKTSSLVYDI